MSIGRILIRFILFLLQDQIIFRKTKQSVFPPHAGILMYEFQEILTSLNPEMR